MSDNLIMAEGRGTTTPRLNDLFSGEHYKHNTLCSDSVQPDSPLRVEAYRLTPGPWYSCIDTFTGRSFGGRYSAREVDYIAAEFRDWPPKPIPPGVFGVVAEAAIKAYGQGGAA